MRYFLVFLLATVPALSQTQAADAERSTLQALLTEVQQLRIAIERSTLLGARTQIAINMMQIQESRTGRVSQDLERVRKEILDLQSRRPRIAEQIKAFEDHLSSLTDPKERQDIEAAIKQTKLEAEQLTATEQDRQARQAELAAQFQTEQSELADLRNRLTEMQRALDQAIERAIPKHTEPRP